MLENLNVKSGCESTDWLQCLYRPKTLEEGQPSVPSRKAKGFVQSLAHGPPGYKRLVGGTYLAQVELKLPLCPPHGDFSFKICSKLCTPSLKPRLIKRRNQHVHAT